MKDDLEKLKEKYSKLKEDKLRAVKDWRSNPSNATLKKEVENIEGLMKDLNKKILNLGGWD